MESQIKSKERDPWIKGILLALLVQLLVFVFWAGAHNQKVEDIDLRLQRLECKLFDGCGK